MVWGFHLPLVLLPLFLVAAAAYVPTEEDMGPMLPADVPRRDAIVGAFRHALEGYRRWAWGHDEVRPVTNRTNDSWGGFGVVAWDALDTAVVMGQDDLADALVELLSNTTFRRDWPAHVFEFTIRYLGSAVASFQLRGRRDAGLLARASELASAMAPAFSEPHGLPRGSVNLATGHASVAGWLAGSAVLAEAGSIQLEFAALSRELGDQTHNVRARRAFDALLRKQRDDGLFPLFMNVETGEWRDQAVSTGALGDSFYEILLKLWLFDGRDPASPLLAAWNKAYHGLKTKLLKKSGKSGLWFFAEINNLGSVTNQMGHLSCHMPAVLALAFSAFGEEEYLTIAENVAATCWKLYEDSASGIGPETVEFFESGNEDYRVLNGKYILRPELIESLFYLYRLTGKTMYRDQAWKIFESLERHCKVPTGYTGLRDVNQIDSHDDSQQSFFFAETLKYLYLVFADSSVLSLDQFIFTTEGHPLEIPPVVVEKTSAHEKEEVAEKDEL